VRIEPVEFVDPPRAAGQEGLDVGIEKGDLAPDFVISDFEGARRRLSDFRGKVVYLNFWATWCTPCLFELPEIQELQERNSDSLVVVAVNRRESLSKAQDWLQGLPRTDGGEGVSFAVNGLDPNDSLYERYVRLKPAMPVSVFINPEGEISAVYNGAMRLPQMEQAVNEALASASAVSNTRH
jgi:thiol-disulfide isomerase/thioredoxin